MPIYQGELKFQFRMRGDEHWQSFQQPLAHFKKKDLRDEETLSEDIHEILYAMDERTYEDWDNVEFSVESYWYDIVVAAHKALYGTDHK